MKKEKILEYGHPRITALILCNAMEGLGNMEKVTLKKLFQNTFKNNHKNRFIIYLEGRGFYPNDIQLKIEILSPQENCVYRHERTVEQMLHGIFYNPFQVILKNPLLEGWYRVNVYLDDHLSQKTTFFVCGEKERD